MIWWLAALGAGLLIGGVMSRARRGSPQAAWHQTWEQAQADRWNAKRDRNYGTIERRAGRQADRGDVTED